MNLYFKNKKITGILTVLPSNEVLFEDEMENYNSPVAKSLKLKAAMGFNKKRIVNKGVTSADLCIAGLTHLFDNELLIWKKVLGTVSILASNYFAPKGV